MPFIARRKGTDERIDITALELPREVLKPGECVCQICGAELIIKAGHFAHPTTCSEEYQSHPESPAHRQAKRFLATFLQEQCNEYNGTSSAYEVPIREVMRIADLVVTFPTGWRVAHEVQLAPITTAQLQKRTNDFSLAGIDVVWWLGKSANTPANRTWSREVFGHALLLTLPNNSADQMSLTVSATSDSQISEEFPEIALSISQFREIVLQRWAYTRTMRNDPRLLGVIKLFASRIRTPCSLPLTHLQAPGASMREAVPSIATSQFRIVQQIAANPVVQEALHLFAANITDIELIQPTPSPAPLFPASPAAVAEASQPVGLAQPGETLPDLQESAHLALKDIIDRLERQVSDLQRQMRRQELEKETLRRQVKRLGGTRPWA
jgi:hypothetical protein